MSATRVIHALLSRLNMRDEDYRTMLWDRYEATSSKNLTSRQANDLVAALHELLPAEERQAHPQPQIAPGTRRRFDRLGDRDRMASPRQLRMLEASWVQRSRAEDLSAKQEAFREFLRNRFRIERIEWIPSDQVGRILRAIQAVDPDAPTKPGKRPSKSIQPKIQGAST
jgi:hypothetical protein